MSLWETTKVWLRRLGILALAIVAVWSVQAAYRVTHPHAAFAFINVGQGKCIAVITPNGRVLLVDGGSQDFNRERWGEQVAQRAILPTLYRLGVRKLDVVMVTHPHEDHCNALPTVISELCPRLFWQPPLESPKQDYLAVKAAIAEVGAQTCPLRLGQRLWLDSQSGVVADVLGPPDGMVVSLTADDADDASAVIKVRFGKVSVLLTGDVKEDGQRWLLRSGADLKATVLDVPHHGSKHNLPEFLRAVSPSYAIISVGRNNSFGHPAKETVSVLQRLGATIWNTGEQGNLVIWTDGDRVKIEGR